jgi:hypothetical protein
MSLPKSIEDFFKWLDSQSSPNEFHYEKSILQELFEKHNLFKKEYESKKIPVPKVVEQLDEVLSVIFTEENFEEANSVAGIRAGFYQLLSVYQSYVFTFLTSDLSNDKLYEQLQAYWIFLQDVQFCYHEKNIYEEKNSLKNHRDFSCIQKYYAESPLEKSLIDFLHNKNQHCHEQLIIQRGELQAKAASSEEQRIELLTQQRILNEAVLFFYHLKQQLLHFNNPGDFIFGSFPETIGTLVVAYISELKTFKNTFENTDFWQLIEPQIIALIERNHISAIELQCKQLLEKQKDLHGKKPLTHENGIAIVKEFWETSEAILLRLNECHSKIQNADDKDAFIIRTKMYFILNFQERLLDFWQQDFKTHTEFHNFVEDTIKQFDTLSIRLADNAPPGLPIKNYQESIAQTNLYVRCKNHDPQSYFSDIEQKKIIVYALGLEKEPIFVWFKSAKQKHEKAIETQFNTKEEKSSSLNKHQSLLYQILKDFIDDKLTEEAFLTKLSSLKDELDPNNKVLHSNIWFWNWGWSQAKREQKAFHTHVGKVYEMCHRKYTELVESRIKDSEHYYKMLDKESVNLLNQGSPKPPVADKDAEKGYVPTRSYQSILSQKNAVVGVVNRRLEAEQKNDKTQASNLLIPPLQRGVGTAR